MAVILLTLEILVGGQTFVATLEDNDTARAFWQKMPGTWTMTELNRNEKYVYLPYNLPQKAGPVGKISTGDLMLYGDNCLVLFYRDFATRYPYTRIARIEDASGLERALGVGEVAVVFRKRGD